MTAAADSEIAVRAHVDTLYLGAGGKSPGLYVLDSATWEVALVHRYSPGESIYATCRAEKWVAAGSRGGKIELFHLDCGPEKADGYPRMTMRDAGNQVTAIAATERGSLVVSDTGGVYLWPDPKVDTEDCRTLDTSQQVICALCASQDEVIGLSRKGHLLTWAVPAGDLLSVVSVPRPGAKAALTCLVACTPSESVAYPASDGTLVRFSPKRGTFTQTPAHRGEAYVVMSSGENLYTAS
jgi:hypothetical protein